MCPGFPACLTCRRGAAADRPDASKGMRQITARQKPALSSKGQTFLVTQKLDSVKLLCSRQNHRRTETRFHPCEGGVEPYTAALRRLCEAPARPPRRPGRAPGLQASAVSSALKQPPWRPRGKPASFHLSRPDGAHRSGASGRWAGDRGFYTHRAGRRWPSSI